MWSQRDCEWASAKSHPLTLLSQNLCDFVESLHHELSGKNFGFGFQDWSKVGL